MKRNICKNMSLSWKGKLGQLYLRHLKSVRNPSCIYCMLHLNIQVSNAFKGTRAWLNVISLGVVHDDCMPQLLVLVIITDPAIKNYIQ